MSIFETNNKLNLYNDDETKCMSKHLSAIVNKKTLLKWFRSYRDHDSFPNLSKTQSRKSNMPYFLAENPDCTKKIIDYCKDNVDVMTMESVHTYIHSTVLPEIIQQIQIERNDSEYDIDALMKEFYIKKTYSYDGVVVVTSSRFHLSTKEKVLLCRQSRIASERILQV